MSGDATGARPAVILRALGELARLRARAADALSTEAERALPL